MIRLRGHHLLCSLTFAGRGYSQQFEQCFKQVIERLKENETILVVSGPDDICESIEGCSESHCRETRISRRDKLALEDLSSHLGIPVSVGSKFAPTLLFDDAYRYSFRQGTTRRACFDCQWSEICDQVAEAEYSSSLLLR